MIDAPIVLLTCWSAFSGAAHAELAHGRAERIPVFVESRPAQPTIPYADGRIVVLPSETRWRPMCGGNLAGMTDDQVADMVRRIRQSGAVMEPVDAASVTASSTAGVAPGSFDLTLQITTALPAGAAEALATVEQYLESQFDNPVTVTINVGFASFPANVLGVTDNNYLETPWPLVRDGLLNGMDASDTIHDFLPAGSTIGVRYDAHTATVTNETRVFVTVANFLATIGSASGPAATLTFNSNIAWDFTPPDIDSGANSFQDVVVHEICHTLGFTSGADFRSGDIELLDVFRFQMTDGAGDFNPDTLDEFMTTPRMVDRDPFAPLNDNDAVTDLIVVEYQMADGFPNQAAHFVDTFPGIYLMDPVLTSQETFAPRFLQSADAAMMDAIGWNYPLANTSCDQASELVCGKTRHFDNFGIVGAADPPYACGAGLLHQGTLWFKFVATDQSAYLSTCGSAGQDSTLAVYEGQCGGLIPLACSEDNGCGGGDKLSSVCLTDLTIGETYYVQVSARTAADRGIYSIELACQCETICEDVCCRTAEEPALEPSPVSKSRYISIVPTDAGRITALRVTLTSLHHPSPNYYPEFPVSDFSAFEGQVRWVGPPADYVDTLFPTTMFHAARLQCEPHFRDWGAEGLIHVTGSAIVPSSLYDVQALDKGCYDISTEESGYSSTLRIATGRWCDITTPFQDPAAPFPPSQPNVLDASAMVDRLRSTPSAFGKVRTQLNSNDPNPASNVTVLDLSNAIDAVKGQGYSFPGPTSCPP